MTGWYVSEAENWGGGVGGTRTQERGTWSRDGVLSADREEPGEGIWAWKMAPPGCVLNLSFIISQSGEFAELNQNPGWGEELGRSPCVVRLGIQKSRAFLLSCTIIFKELEEGTKRGHSGSGPTY